MPRRRYYSDSSPPDDQDDTNPARFAAMFARLEEVMKGHARAIDSTTVEIRQQADNINQLIVAIGRVTDGVATLKESQERIIQYQQTMGHDKEADHASMRIDISRLRTEVDQIKSERSATGNRAFALSQNAVQWGCAGVGLLFTLLSITVAVIAIAVNHH